MIIAGLERYLALDQPAGRLEVEEEYLGLQQRGADPLSSTRPGSFQQGHEDRLGGEQAGGEVCNGDAGPHRTPARLASDRHQTAHPLGHLVEAGPVTIGAILAEPGDRGIHQPRVALVQFLVPDAQAVFDLRSVVFDHHVGPVDQAKKHGQSGRRLQVDNRAALVAVQILKVGTIAAASEPARPVALGAFDLHHIRTPICQLANTGRAGPDPGEIEDPQAPKGVTCRQERHTPSSLLSIPATST